MDLGITAFNIQNRLESNPLTSIFLSYGVTVAPPSERGLPPKARLDAEQKAAEKAAEEAAKAIIITLRVIIITMM